LLFSKTALPIWRWTLPSAAAVASAFFIVDAAFLAANLAKIADGGYVPLLLAAAVYGGVMLVWHVGAQAVSARLQETVVPIASFMARIAEGRVPRVPGTGVFLTRTERDAPPVMVWHLKHNRALHERLFVLTVVIESVPWIGDASRLNVKEIAPRFWRATARYGFMERPDIPALLETARSGGCGINLSDVTYYVGHETVVPSDSDKRLPRWVEALFAAMQRNSVHVSDYFKLPRDAVVEIGREVAI
jgi:KUP system potassium uptake protein